MTKDPLDKLDEALRRHTPPARASAQEVALRAAMEGFDAVQREAAEEISQGSGAEVRPMSDRPHRAARIWTGAKTMLTRLTSPRGLTATTALATGVVAIVAVQNIGPMNFGPVDPAAQPEAYAPPAPTSTVAAEPMVEEEVSADEVGTVAKLEQTPERRATPPSAPLADMAVQEAPMAAAPVDQSMNELVELDMPSALAGRANRMRAPGEVQRNLLSASPLQRSVIQPERRVPDALRPPAEANTEAFPEAPVNPIKRVLEEPVSTFSVDVDTAAYSLVRSSLQNGYLPPREAVRIEEMINYFDYAYPAPVSAEVPFETSVSVAATPWNPDTKLLHIGIQGYESVERPPVNLVFLIDTSGSMEDPKKLPLLRQSFKLLVESLSPQDSIAIVTYAGSAGMALEPTPASEPRKILAALDQLSAGGSTAGQAGLQQAYALAEEMAEDGEISRVILATDGDFNVGISDPEALKSFIEDKRESGTYLSVLGFGRGNYNDAIMQSLAQNGNGTAAYIDTLAEAQKVLVEEMTANLFPIAGDVKIQIEFNPAQISEYRLIGYETRALKREDFNNDAVDAGEIGAGHRVTALYEITPKGSPAEQISDLRYAEAAAEEEVNPTRELAYLKLRYKRPGEDRSNLIETPVLPDRADIDPGETGFAAAVAGVGQLLRGESLPGGWSYRDALALASASRGEDPYGYRAEFLTLIRLADALD